MLFTPGPTEIEEEMKAIGAMDLPYFRDKTYTDMVLALTDGVKYLLQTESTPLTLTASGSGVMEMAILNLLNVRDKVVVLNGGSFGKKWVDMCQAFELEVVDFQVELGKLPDLEALNNVLASDVKALMVNAHETSTGLLNDIEKLGKLTHQKGILLIVDGVSSIGSDPFYMDRWHVDCAMVSSQKALACMPGISFIAFSQKALDVIPSVKRPRYYFDALEYLNNIPRGMLPYTPAMTVTYQVHQRIEQIKQIGLEQYIAQQQQKAMAFRKKIAEYRFKLFAERPTNSMSSFYLPEYCGMRQVVNYLKEKYDWYVAPNPTQVEHYLRVSHMGNISIEQLQALADKIQEACLFYKNQNN